MSSIKKLSIVPYNPEWPDIFEKEKKLLIEALDDNYISVHHIGSTAIPGLTAKPKIDIIAEVVDPEKTIIQVGYIGYQYRGEFNIPLHWGFAKREEIDFNLHIYHQGNPEVELNILFRDMLRSNPDYIKEYSNLKQEILADPKSYLTNKYSFAEYTLRKGLFIKKILNKAKFEKDRLLFCSADEEWNEYHRIKRENFFEPLNIKYNQHHASMSDPDHYHFILYHGTTIVAAAHVQFLENNDAMLSNFTIDRPFQNQNHDFQMLEKIESWLKVHLKKRLFTFARKTLLKFFKENNFSKTVSKNYSVDPQGTAMKKEL